MKKRTLCIAGAAAFAGVAGLASITHEYKGPALTEQDVNSCIPVTTAPTSPSTRSAVEIAQDPATAKAVKAFENCLNEKTAAASAPRFVFQIGQKQYTFGL